MLFRIERGSGKILGCLKKEKQEEIKEDDNFYFSSRLFSHFYLLALRRDSNNYHLSSNIIYLI